MKTMSAVAIKLRIQDYRYRSLVWM